ncbi:MAG: glycosyltransferase family 2 protein, partial [Bacteroidaceae bacterium]|nr:glycosyltransferase family 2 protein [Bacteroidaceae bacterium]
GGTLPKDNPQKTFLNFRNNLLLLYKNLPEERLRPVMRWRFWLDALASLEFFLSGQWGSFRAVWRARRAFGAMRADFEADRRRNLAASVLSPVPEQASFLLLWQYYVLRRRRWSDLPSR